MIVETEECKRCGTFNETGMACRCLQLAAAAAGEPEPPISLPPAKFTNFDPLDLYGEEADIYRDLGVSG